MIHNRRNVPKKMDKWDNFQLYYIGRLADYKRGCKTDSKGRSREVQEGRPPRVQTEGGERCQIEQFRFRFRNDI